MPIKAKFALLAALGLAIGCAGGRHHEDHEDDGDEVKMSINDIPAAARAGLQREAGGATITTVDKEQKHGKTVYETDVTLGGKEWEITVDADGNLVSKKIESDDDDHGKKEDDDEKEEHAHKKHT